MQNKLMVVSAIAGLAWIGLAQRGLPAEADSGLIIVVGRDGKGDFAGTDEEAIQAAVDKARQAGGGTVQIGPGEYLIRRGIVLTDGITIRGSRETVLKLASPVTVASPAKQGQDSIVVSDASELAADTRIEIYPPAGMKTFPDSNKEKHTVEIRRIEHGRLILSGQLPCPVPEKSRVGYPSNLFFVGGSGRNIRLENLVLDGGVKQDIPMPGHCERCALLAHGIWSYAEGPTAPPIENLRVAECHIRNCYGRAVAMYSVVRSSVKNCLIEDIDDEGIDLDHFCYHCEVSGNTVKRSGTGVTINDGSYCTIRGNRFENCGVGVVMWWWHLCPQENLNVENLIENNVIVAPKKAGISLEKKCLRNRVIGNTVAGGIKVAEPDNVVEKNVLSEN
jgi:parallel beta-helix repeat protein